ncbi:MAG: hypothetical protein GX552_05830 [Chloroflexi bacterium]|jgi:hypothetical protein|nr:hypothetical protein [Chloroflexota bacterium]
MRVDEIKKQEEEEKEGKEETLRVYLAFRDGFFQRLREFSDEAVEAGVEGACACRETDLNGGILQLDFTLNKAELVIIAPSDIYWLRDSDGEGLYGDRLAGKLFLYRSRSAGAKPSIDVAVERLLNGRYVCEMFCYPETGDPTALFHEWLDLDTIAETGAHAADRLVDYFYGLKNSWLDHPTLGAFLGRRGEGRRMGFTTSF